MLVYNIFTLLNESYKLLQLQTITTITIEFSIVFGRVLLKIFFYFSVNNKKKLQQKISFNP